MKAEKEFSTENLTVTKTDAEASGNPEMA